MPSMCFPSPGGTSDNSAGPIVASPANAVPRPTSSPRSAGGGYAGVFDDGTTAQLELEASSGQGASLFSQSGDGRGLWLLIALAAGAYFLSEKR